MQDFQDHNKSGVKETFPDNFWAQQDRHAEEAWMHSVMAYWDFTQ